MRSTRDLDLITHKKSAVGQVFPAPPLCRASPAERAQRADALRPLKDRKTKRKGERERWVRPNEESLASLGRHYEKLAWRF